MENESIADGPAPDMFADVWNPSDVEQSDAETSELGSERSQQNFIPSTMQHRNSLPPHMHLHQRPRALTYANGSTSVFSNNSPHHEYPLTPELSPNPNQYTTYKRYIQPMDFLTNHPMQDTFSDTDTIDREVAATTSGLAIASPRQHPYHNAWQRGRKSVTDGTQTETTAPPVAGPIQAPERLSSSEQALENLQTEVAALCEQLDMMRRSMTERDAQKRQYRWTWLWLIKTIAKHAFANVIILLLVFLALWRQKSPIAYAIIGYVGPRLKEIMRYMVRRVVFWKVTV
ncbi:uncharacterized protein BYT42DRAFT_316119 [Radiomyces spectabilis]|uniref:uncharacterized protein n=1 Tax=Radiomyces spectabilis TaxID=64574 RepID=UPI00221E39D1|nr:uncharacterized protein BYT42DRAFT_316119 [Radiomyces spectabilis]KAI8379167.1 hypothetical protein BYT42DRAFT_316119 [Radiomyces spectabilis]